VEQLLDHILILSPQRLLLDASVQEIQEKYAFEYRTPDQMQDVLYSEPSLQGNAVIAARKAGDAETQVNLELLFNAVNEGKI
jgi:ABC-2 type transport system ATP-binding protein